MRGSTKRKRGRRRRRKGNRWRAEDEGLKEPTDEFELEQGKKKRKKKRKKNYMKTSKEEGLRLMFLRLQLTVECTQYCSYSFR
jgi:hypothetical protein